MVNHDGIVRRAARVMTLTIHGTAGRIELHRYGRPHATVEFDPSDRRLRARLVKAFLEHQDEHLAPDEGI
jgi:hypothetical protein